MRPYSKALLGLVAACLIGCSEVTPPPAPPPAAPETSPAAPVPVPVVDAPKAYGSLTMISSREIKALLEQPLDGSAAASELVRRDGINDIAGRCAPKGVKAGEAQSISPKKDEIDADSLKIGMVPTAVPPALAAQLTQKTRLWQLNSQGFDFYKTLSAGSPEGLKEEMPAVACIRYSLFRAADLYSDMIFSVTHNPKKPQILTILPVRVYYRDFAALADQPNVTQAAIKVILEMHSFTLDRTSGRVAAPLQNQEMLIELWSNPGAGQPIYQLYDPVNGPAATIPLPPWDFSTASVNPRHNFSLLGITVTEIADFDWLRSQTHILWPGYEYASTDVSKLTLGALYYRRTHGTDLTNP